MGTREDAYGSAASFLGARPKASDLAFLAREKMGSGRGLLELPRVCRKIGEKSAHGNCNCGGRSVMPVQIASQKRTRPRRLRGFLVFPHGRRTYRYLRT